MHPAQQTPQPPASASPPAPPSAAAGAGGLSYVVRVPIGRTYVDAWVTVSGYRRGTTCDRGDDPSHADVDVLAIGRGATRLWSGPDALALAVASGWIDAIDAAAIDAYERAAAVERAERRAA